MAHTAQTHQGMDTGPLGMSGWVSDTRHWQQSFPLQIDLLYPVE